MTLPEGFSLIHRSKVSDEAMKTYRRVMAPHWFKDDQPAQLAYINSPPKAPNYVTQNLCLIKDHEVKGTISLYSFRYPYSDSVTTIDDVPFDITSLPTWLTKLGYLGDNSVTPDIEGQGIMQAMVAEIIHHFPHAYLLGITKKENLGMRTVFEKTGATIHERNSVSSPSFYQPKNPRALSLDSTKSRLTHTPLYASRTCPPVVHLFHDSEANLVCATIGTTPNYPGDTSAQTTSPQLELFANQTVGFINPEIKISSDDLDTIYARIARYQYLSLFQLASSTQMTGHALESGYERGSVVAIYSN